MSVSLRYKVSNWRIIEMKFLKMILVLFFCCGLVQVGFGQPDTLWTKKIMGINACSIVDDPLGGVIVSTWVDLDTIGRFSRLYSINSNGVIIDEKNYIFDVFWRNSIHGIYIDSYRNNKLMLYGSEKRVIMTTPDTPYINLIIKKIDSDFSIIFENKYLKESYYNPFRVYTTNDGGFIADYNDEYRKYDASGDSVGIFPHEYGRPFSLSDGVLFFYTGLGSDEIRMRKVDFDGNLLWDSVLHDFVNEFSCTVCRTEEGGYLFLSGIEILTRIDSTGSIISHTALVNDSFEYDGYVSTINQTSDGGLIALIIDNTNIDNLIVVKYNKNGFLSWSKKFNRKVDVLFVKETNDKGFLIVGAQCSLKPVEDNYIWMVKLEPDVTNINELETGISNYHLPQNYPNPFNPSTTIEFSLAKSEFVELKIYNILGKEVSTLVSKKLNQGNHTYTFDGKNLASGIYYYQLVASDYREVKKMILIK